MYTTASKIIVFNEYNFAEHNGATLYKPDDKCNFCKK